MANQLPITIDIEASGFGTGSYPIEIGIVFPNRQRFCCLIKPERNWTHWSEQAQQLHKIPRTMLFEHGLDVSQVSHQLNALLMDKTIYTDAWGHDYSWLAKLYDAANCQPSFKLDNILSIMDKTQIELWQATKLRLSQQLTEQRHRASTDAALLQACYEHTLMKLDKY